ncbi:MAG: hypothetical protein QOE54_5770, partial [Streptosporangiaceae bacterium]|nr:hypothetical protein [Streptosporangiaceae bacterium]
RTRAPARLPYGWDDGGRDDQAGGAVRDAQTNGQASASHWAINGN